MTLKKIEGRIVATWKNSDGEQLLFCESGQLIQRKPIKIGGLDGHELRRVGGADKEFTLADACMFAMSSGFLREPPEDLTVCETCGEPSIFNEKTGKHIACCAKCLPF